MLRQISPNTHYMLSASTTLAAAADAAVWHHHSTSCFDVTIRHSPTLQCPILGRFSRCEI